MSSLGVAWADSYSDKITELEDKLDWYDKHYDSGDISDEYYDVWSEYFADKLDKVREERDEHYKKLAKANESESWSSWAHKKYDKAKEYVDDYADWALGGIAIGAVGAVDFIRRQWADDDMPKDELTKEDVLDEMKHQLDAGQHQRMQANVNKTKKVNKTDVNKTDVNETDVNETDVVLNACELEYMNERIGDYVGENEELVFDEPNGEEVEAMQAPVYGIDTGIREAGSLENYTQSDS
jgi:hypothetical protein